jgi:hypothetical protein
MHIPSRKLTSTSLPWHIKETRERRRYILVVAHRGLKINKLPLINNWYNFLPIRPLISLCFGLDSTCLAIAVASFMFFIYVSEFSLLAQNDSVIKISATFPLAPLFITFIALLCWAHIFLLKYSDSVLSISLSLNQQRVIK